jgi:hypothetical protein
MPGGTECYYPHFANLYRYMQLVQNSVINNSIRLWQWDTLKLFSNQWLQQFYSATIFNAAFISRQTENL